MSYITLYASKHLQQGKNFLIEDFSSYLATLTGSYSFDKFQYIRPLKTIIIKLDNDQINATPFPASKYNYLSLKLSGSTDLHPYYYFITHKVQKAASTIEFTCEMDVLNTFSWNTDYLVDNKTLVMREHKDRLFQLDDYFRNYEIGNQTTTVVLDKWYALDLDLFFSNTAIILQCNAEFLICNTSTGSLVQSIPKRVMLNRTNRIRCPSLLLSDPYVQFCQYNTSTMTESNSSINIYESQKDNYVVFVHADSASIVNELNTFCSYTGHYVLEVNDYIAYKPYIRKINMRSEGINAPQYKTSEEEIIDKIDTPWVLFYRNENNLTPSDYEQVNPVNCYLMPKTSQKVNYTATDGTLSYSDINDGDVIIIAPKYNEIQPYVYANGKKFYTVYNSYNSITVIYIERIGSNLKVSPYTYYRNPNTGQTGRYLYNTFPKPQTASSITFDKPQSEIKVYKQNGELTAANFWGGSFDYIHSNNTLTFGSLTSADIIGTSEIDRTDQRNIKIIQLPYSPTDFEYDDSTGIIDFSSSWEYIALDKMLKLNDEDIEFKHTFNFKCDIWNQLYIGYGSYASNDLRNDYLESKIYHSDYFYYKFVYDSFNLQFNYELMNFESYFNNGNVYDLTIEFIPSRNIVSKFLFKFPQYQLQYSTADYDNIVAVARNNEEVLYSSQYINYLRTGYNYDIKAKERTQVAGTSALIASIIATTAGVVGGIASGNYGAAGLSAVVGISSIANSSIGYAKSLADNEQGIARKLEESQKQAVSVQNADDIDLLMAYSNNRAKLCKYEVSPAMKKALLDMFYYSGYETIERKTPSINTRYWFNYLQCELVTEQSTTAYLSDELLEEIKKCFKEGVTFFHHHTTWDLDQVKENYESWILS